jgi:hypothetical protein
MPPDSCSLVSLEAAPRVDRVVPDTLGKRELKT